MSAALFGRPSVTRQALHYWSAVYTCLSSRRLRTADARGRVERHNLADDEPVKSMRIAASCRLILGVMTSRASCSMWVATIIGSNCSIVAPRLSHHAAKRAIARL